MSDVQISLYTSVVKFTGENIHAPSLPPSLEEIQPAINPPGTSDISGLVPYNGAIDNVNLGEKGLSTGFVQYDNTPTDTPTGSGTVVWNPDKYTLDLSMGLGDSVQQIGMETYYTPVKNQTGSLITDGTFVMATGSLGASGRITVAPAVTDGSVDSRYMLGVTTHDIANGGDGLVTWFGEIRGFNTNTKAPVGETWIDGTVLWNNPAVAGGFTSVEPQAPNLKIPVAIVISAGNNGVIFVRPRLGMRLTDLHDVDAFTPSSNDLIAYNGTKWEAKSLADIGGIGGTIASGQVAFGTGVNTIGGNADFVWDNSSKYLNILVSGTQIARLGNGIGTLEGALQLYTSAGVENIRFRAGSISFINNTFGFGIGTTSPTNALDVAGQTRIRTIANGDGYFLTKNSNGVITASQSLYQLSTSVGIGLTTPSGGLHIRRDSLYNAEGNTSLIIDGGSVVGAVKLLIGVDTTNDVAYIESMQASTGWNKNLAIQAMGGLVGIATISPTNTLDVNGTARIRSLTGTTGYLPLMSSTGVMGQSVAYNAGTGIVINGTFLPSGAVFSVNGVSYFNNWATAGAYDKLSIDFGENRGFGYDPTPNEIFVKGATTVPVKIDTDAPTDSLVINSSGNVSVGGQLHSPVVAKGNSSTAVTFDWNDGNIQTVTLTANCTFTFSNPQSGASYQIIITQDATGSRTITWPTGIYWEGKTIPSLTGTASSRDIVTITYDGTNYNALIARNFGT